MLHMAHLAHAFEGLADHREVVPIYYVRGACVFIVTGLTRTHGGACIIDGDGRFVRSFASKADALASLRHSSGGATL